MFAWGLFDLELPSAGTATTLVVLGAVVGASLRFLTSKQKLDDTREMNLAAEFHKRLEIVEGELKGYKTELAQCQTQHQQCNDRVRRLEVANEARVQNDDLHKLILTELRAIGAEAISGRTAAVAELKAYFGEKPPTPPSATGP